MDRPMIEWYPIESVPKELDNDSVLLSNGHQVWEDWWGFNDISGDEMWMYDDQWEDHEHATHWSPMPMPFSVSPEDNP